jgi:hypothetical protein
MATETLLRPLRQGMSKLTQASVTPAAHINKSLLSRQREPRHVLSGVGRSTNLGVGSQIADRGHIVN